jgi:hypothetical protein
LVNVERLICITACGFLVGMKNQCPVTVGIKERDRFTLT